MIMFEENNPQYAERPRPLATIADRTVRVVGTLSALVTALAGSGIALLSAEQADALTALLGALPGLAAGLGVVLAAFGIVKNGEREVTPTSDPMTRDKQTGRLVPLVPQNRAA